MGAIEGVIFEQEAMQLPSIYGPLDSLFGEYQRERAAVEQIAAYIASVSGVMHYFMEGANKEQRGSSLTADRVFKLEPALAAMNARYWSKAMLLTDVLEHMPAGKRNDWNKQIQNHETPEFEPESVKATLRELLAQRQAFFAERVDGIFRNLSGEHVTNSPAAFGKRMIINWILDSYGYTNHGRVNYIHDLRCVIAKFMGRDEPFANATYRDIDSMVRSELFGEWVLFDGGAFRVRIYKKGTAHLEVHPDMAWRLNAVLASLYPAAIPPEFRRRPVKQKAVKEFVLDHDLVSFGALCALSDSRIGSDGTSVYFNMTLPPAAEKVLGYLGGVRVKNQWCFDYDVRPVFKELLRTGSIPEQKSHQYYPTPENIAQDVIELAEIDDRHMVLEPSAGQGGLAELASKQAMHVECVEISPLHCKILEAKGFKPTCADFMQLKPNFAFDRIVMNPPFAGGRALEHLTKAAGLLADEGRLVAVLPASMKGKELVPGFVHEWHKTYTNEFQGTGVSVAVLVLTVKG